MFHGSTGFLIKSRAIHEPTKALWSNWVVHKLTNAAIERSRICTSTCIAHLHLFSLPTWQSNRVNGFPAQITMYINKYPICVSLISSAGICSFVQKFWCWFKDPQSCPIPSVTLSWRLVSFVQAPNQPNFLLAWGIKVVQLTHTPQRAGVGGEIEMETKQVSILGIKSRWKMKKDGVCNHRNPPKCQRSMHVLRASWCWESVTD